jgi:hypothetical protein
VLHLLSFGTDGGIRLTILKRDIDGLSIETYIKDVRKIESIKNNFNKVSLHIYHYEPLSVEWYRIKEVRLFMKLLLRNKPQLLYFASEESFDNILKCLLDKENESTSGTRKAITKILEQATIYAEKVESHCEAFSSRVYEKTGFKRVTI